MLIALWIPSCWQSSSKIFDVKRVSLLEIIFLGNPMKGNTRSLKSSATPTASIVSLHGSKITPFVQSWLVIVSMESYPLESGSLVMKSIEMVVNGSLLMVLIGCIGGLLGFVTIFTS